MRSCTPKTKAGILSIRDILTKMTRSVPENLLKSDGLTLRMRRATDLHCSCAQPRCPLALSIFMSPSFHMMLPPFCLFWRSLLTNGEGTSGPAESCHCSIRRRFFRKQRVCVCVCRACLGEAAPGPISQGVASHPSKVSLPVGRRARHPH